VVWSAIAGLIWLPERESEATDARVREGIAIAVVFLGTVPTVVYYALGRLLGGRRRLLLLVAIASAVPGYFYLFFGILIVADHVSCAPDAHECPL
jgi:hypothetical protein